MRDTLIAPQTEIQGVAGKPGLGKRVSILGVPLGFGCGIPGVDIGPAALRVARLNQRVAQLGYEVRDLGDMRIVRPSESTEPQKGIKYLPEIAAVCEDLASEVQNILGAGELPVTI